MDSRKIVFKETAVVLIGQIFCVAAMLGIYALLDRLDVRVLLGGVMGGLLATLNFFFMAVGTSLAADKAQADDAKGGAALIRYSYLIRLVLLVVILVACAKSGYFDVLPLVLPLAFTRPVITVAEFFRKKG